MGKKIIIGLAILLMSSYVWAERDASGTSEPATKRLKTAEPTGEPHRARSGSGVVYSKKPIPKAGPRTVLPPPRTNTDKPSSKLPKDGVTVPKKRFLVGGAGPAERSTNFKE